MIHKAHRLKAKRRDMPSEHPWRATHHAPLGHHGQGHLSLHEARQPLRASCTGEQTDQHLRQTQGCPRRRHPKMTRERHLAERARRNIGGSRGRRRTGFSDTVPVSRAGMLPAGLGCRGTYEQTSGQQSLASPPLGIFGHHPIVEERAQAVGENYLREEHGSWPSESSAWITSELARKRSFMKLPWTPICLEQSVSSRLAIGPGRWSMSSLPPTCRDDETMPFPHETLRQPD